MTLVKNIDGLMKNLKAYYYTKIGEGEKADFYMMLNEYKGSLRITFCVVNPKSLWLGGKFGVPIEFAPKLFAQLGKILKMLKRGEVEAKVEQGSSRKNNFSC